MQPCDCIYICMYIYIYSSFFFPDGKEQYTEVLALFFQRSA